MPPKKRKQRSKTSSSASSSQQQPTQTSSLSSRRTNRRSLAHALSPQKRSKRSSQGDDDGDRSIKAAEAALIASNTMHTITHHTSFVPSLASLQHKNEIANHSHSFNNTTSAAASDHKTASNGIHNIKNSASKSLSKSTSSSADAKNKHISGSGSGSGNSSGNSSGVQSHKRPYALYHPRNLGLVPPTVKEPKPTEGDNHGKVTIPHSAGCRMKFLPEPTFRTLPIHPDFQNTNNDNENSNGNDNDNYISTAGLTCPTVMNNSHSSSGQVAIGDTGGSVTLYTTIPYFLPVLKLHTSASKRFMASISKSQSKRKKKKTKRIGRSQAIVGSSIDRSQAVDAVLLLKKTQCVVVGTRMEIECVSFENKIRWTWEGCLGWDNAESKMMYRGIPMRLHGDCRDEFVLASFGFFAFKETGVVKSDSDANDNENDDDNANAEGDGDGGGNVNGAEMDGDKSTTAENLPLSPKIEKPELYSPLLKINVATGEFTNVVPIEKCTTKGADTWNECNIGTRAMGIYDKLHRGNIIGVFIIYQNQDSVSSTNNTSGSAGINDDDSISNSTPVNAIQELMVLDGDCHILHRVTIPTKTSGTKLVTVEAINQSPNGDYTISATSKGGILVYKTDKLQLLGAYGEGVSLHGHSIVWQDIFFIRIEKSNQLDDDMDDDNVDFGGVQKQWGKILERSDELMHRERYKSKRKEMARKRDNLNQLFIVSVPSAFREPVDMKEHIQFWDVSRLEFDCGNKLPSFELIAPKKSEGICTLLYDHSAMTSNAGKFVMSTHAGDCLDMTPTLVSDWAGQMYPTGFLVLDNNLAYIEDEDELDQVVDSHLDQHGLCQGIVGDVNINAKQSEAELELALQMSLMDEYVDVVGDNSEEWNESILNVAPCRPEPHLRVKSERKTKDSSQATGGVEGIQSSDSMFDLMKTLPQFSVVQDALKNDALEAQWRIDRIEENRKKLLDPPIKIPRRKQGNIDYIIEASVDKQLTIEMLERRGTSNGNGSTLIPKVAGISISATENVCKAEDISALPVAKIDAAHGIERLETIDRTAATAPHAALCDMGALESEVAAKGIKSVESATDEDPSNYCPACHGRFVIHNKACGKRARPTDYDAIAKAEQDKKDKAEAEKKKILQDRRKVAEQRRKEKKLRLKEEAKKLQLEKEEEEKKKNEIQTTVDLTTSEPAQSNHFAHTEFQSSPAVHTVTSNAFENNSTDQYQSAYTYNSSYHQQLPHELSSPQTPNQSSQIYQQQEITSSTVPKSSPSFGNINFGDSMFCNIPTLPSEPSSYYNQNGNGGNHK